MLRLEACHPPGLLEVWVFPEFHSGAHSSKVTGARCVSVWCSGSSRKPTVWLKEKAVLRTRHMLLAPDKWCLTAPLAPCPPCSPVECALSGLHSQPARPWLRERERAEACSLGLTLGHLPHSRGSPLTCRSSLIFFSFLLWFLFYMGFVQSVKQKTKSVRIRTKLWWRRSTPLSC